MSDFVRRQMFTEPGEPLPVMRSPLDAAHRLFTFLDVSGLPSEQVMLSNMVCVPIPLAKQADHPRDKWPQVNPAILWHPLFWLPTRVRGRYMVEDNGDSEPEDDNTWAARVAIEMTQAGTYSGERGDWLDVFHYACGIDVSKPEDLQRVIDWYHGADDPELDGVQAKIDELYDDSDQPDWAVNYALDMTALYAMMSWAFQAEAMIEACNDVIAVANGEPVLSAGEQPTADQAIYMAKNLPMFGYSVFTDVSDNEREWWEATDEETERLGDDLHALATGPVQSVLERVGEIHRMFWPVVETLSGGDDQPGDDTGTPPDGPVPATTSNGPAVRGGWE